MLPRTEAEVAMVMVVLHREVVLQVEWEEASCQSEDADARNG